ncbi:MAG: type II toxin-antitoxin system RelE/ParE family toxin [Anaerolineales bacterium]|nr:type II toxin-antitoxin system RelE/ParE family toxin [Anaerolineales bacterium]
MTKIYALKFHSNLEKQLLRIPSKERQRIVETIRSLAIEPRPAGYVKLENSLYRVRQGSYRIIYGIFDMEVVVVICKIARRTEDTYKDIQPLLKQALRLIKEE